MFIEVLLVSGIVAALNGGFWLRNIRTYGSPYGTPIPVGLSHDIREPEPWIASVEKTTSERGSALHAASIPIINAPVPVSIRGVAIDDGQKGIALLRDWFTTVIQMIAMNFVTPVRSINLHYFSLLSRISGLFPTPYIDLLDAIAWNQENLAGSPLHLFAAISSTAACWWLLRKKGFGLTAVYGASAWVGYCLLAFIGHVTVVYSIRYQLAYLVLCAPLVGVVAGTCAESLDQEWGSGDPAALFSSLPIDQQHAPDHWHAALADPGGEHLHHHPG